MRNWRSFTVLCVSLLLVCAAGTLKVRGCSYTPYVNVWPNEFASYHISFFPADLGYERLLLPFMFRTNPDALDEWDSTLRGPTEDASLTEVNLREWAAFLHGRVERREIEELIYRRDPRELQALQAKLAGGRSVTERNGLVRYIQETRQYGILAYIVFARRCEPFAAYDGDPWHFAARMEEVRNPRVMQGLIDEGLRLLAGTGAGFLKLRYAYQIVRLAHYARLDQDCVGYFDTLVPGHDDGSVYYYQALRHKAGALLRLGRKPEAMVLFSLVFDQCPPLIVPAYRDMRLLKPDDWQECLRLAGHPHRRATLWLLRSIMDGERLNLEPLTRMYELEPRSPRLEFLLVRQINKIEKTLVRSEFFLPGPAPDRAEAAYIEDLLAFVQGVDAARVHRPALWPLAAGYLSLLLGRHEEAASYLDRAGEARPDALTQGVLGLLRCLDGLARAEAMRDDLEGPCLASLQWLASLDPGYNHPIVRRSLLILMAQKYFRAKREIEGLCCLDNTGYRVAFEQLVEADPGDLERTIAFAAGAGRSPLQAYLARGMSLSLDDLRFMLATKLLRRGLLAEALSSLNRISPSFFSDRVYPIHTSFEANLYNARTGLFRIPLDELAPLDKRAFLVRVNGLLATAQKHPERADVCYYRIANGFFHSPAWRYYQEVSWQPYFEAGKPNPRYPFVGERPLGKETAPGPDDLYTGPKRTLAWQFYEKALAVTKDRELAAECCFLAAASQTRFSYQVEFTPPGRGRDYYYDLLRRKYADTRYYRRVIAECADLRAYLNR